MEEHKQIPPWYQSSQGPQIAMTVKGIALMMLPAVKSIWGIEIGNETVDAVIDAVMVLAFGGIAVYGYARSKKQPSN